MAGAQESADQIQAGGSTVAVNTDDADPKSVENPIGQTLRLMQTGGGR